MLYPDDYWAAYNLGVESNKLPRADAAAVFKAHLVDRWPNSPRARLYAAQQAVHDGGDSSSVLTAIDRARALASNGSDEMQWLTLAPAFIAWADADPARAVSALEQSTRASLGLGDPDALSLQAGLLSLSSWPHRSRTGPSSMKWPSAASRIWHSWPSRETMHLQWGDGRRLRRRAPTGDSVHGVLARADQFDELLRIDATRPSTPRGATRLDVEMAHGATATRGALARQSLGMTRGDPSSQPNLGVAGCMACTPGLRPGGACCSWWIYFPVLALLPRVLQGLPLSAARPHSRIYPNGYYWLADPSAARGCLSTRRPQLGRQRH